MKILRNEIICPQCDNFEIKILKAHSKLINPEIWNYGTYGPYIPFEVKDLNKTYQSIVCLIIRCLSCGYIWKSLFFLETADKRELDEFKKHPYKHMNMVF